MNIEIGEPRLEALIRQRMATGRFQSVEDALIQALESTPIPPEEDGTNPSRSLAEVFAAVRGVLTDEEVDTLFRRDPSPGRPVDLS